MQNNFTWDFFIAHCSIDVKEAEEMYSYLEKSARVFLDSKNLKLGDDWDIELANAQQCSAITLVLVSSKTEKAYYQREEIASAIALARDENSQHRVIPIYLDNVKDVPYGLRLKQGLKISKNLSIEEAVNILLNEFVDLLGNPRQKVNSDNQSVLCKSEDINLNVSNYNYNDYKSNMINDCVKIEPDYWYLKLCKRGGTIKDIDYLWEPFNVDLPSLDFKIVNNSKNTIFLSDVVFDIRESKLDPSPVIYISYDKCQSNARHIRLHNDGWGEVKNFELKLLSIPPQKAEGYNIKNCSFTHDLLIGDFTDSINVDITNVLKDSGIDLDKIDNILKQSIDYNYKMESIIPYLGEYRKGYAKILGVMEFDGEQVNRDTRRYRIFFETEVFIYNSYNSFLPEPPSYVYKTKFEVEGNDYQCQVPISHVLKPGEADRFIITIGMEKSSEHIFDVRVLYNDNNVMCCNKSFDLLSFIPRSKAGFLMDKPKNRFKW